MITAKPEYMYTTQSIKQSLHDQALPQNLLKTISDNPLLRSLIISYAIELILGNEKIGWINFFENLVMNIALQTSRMIVLRHLGYA
jgi:hypothetical protein